MSAVEQRMSRVVGAVDVDRGDSSDLAVVVRGVSGEPAFVKGVRGVSRRMRWLRNEITGSLRAPGIAPNIVFHADVDDWLIVGFTYVPGRRADLRPGSADLPLVAETLSRINRVRTPDLRPLRDRWSGTDWWTRLADEAPEHIRGWDAREMARVSAAAPALVDGTSLLHTDLHADQFLISETNRVHVIDWGFPGSGAPWVDTAFMTLRLVDAGHTPAEAESWARTIPAYADATPDALTAFAAYVAGFWTHLSLSAGHDARHRARLAQTCANWRLGSPVPTT
ncbi:phosphotransferase family protein [Actinokineospora spheciospongiae]|uniref:phosphotransferase family protein n=1 Tax=Actinokineospora spheciospongiae TaxID=909613 RepID=UPI001F39450C|nr:aminoglycoside phosphotransferase family protein [Actinokineospora spheciospongiae]